MTASTCNSSRAQLFNMRHALTFTVAAALSATCVSGFAATYSVTNTQNSGAGSLRQAILDANASGAHAGIVNGSNSIQVTATGTINLGDALPMVFSNLTINGNGIVVDGGNAHRCFFVSGLPTTVNGAPQVIAVTLSNLNLDHCLARAGNGGSGVISGGGGLGAGGALFVNAHASVTLGSVTIDHAGAIGGNGGSSVSGGTGGGGGMGGSSQCNGSTNTLVGCGGGGLGGDGGSASMSASGGGGGIGGNAGTGATGSNTGGGGGGGFGGTGIGEISVNQGFSAAGSGYQGIPGGANAGGGGGGGGGATVGDAGTAGGTGGAGGSLGGGGGGGFNAGISGTNGGAGGIGGGGGGSDGSGGNGGDGGFGGGGGGRVESGGGAGGFGGGGGAFAGGGFGGGGGCALPGGFGGGGGSDSPPTGFGGGIGGSDSANGFGDGGGGGAMGGAIFVVDGGNLLFSGNGNLGNSSLSAGLGGPNAHDGSTFGTGIFLHGNGSMSFDVDNGALYTLTDAVSDVQGSGGGNGSGSWGLRIDGDGAGGVVLGAANSYSGPTEVVSGQLELDGSVTSLTTVDAGGVLAGIGTAVTVVNNGVVAPGNATSAICLPPANYQFTVANFSQSTSGKVLIEADPCGGATQLVVTGTAGLGGTLYMLFDGSPVPGETFTLMTASAFNGAFDRYQTNMPSVFGQIVYLPHSIQFHIVANDEIFRDGFD